MFEIETHDYSIANLERLAFYYKTIKIKKQPKILDCFLSIFILTFESILLYHKEGLLLNLIFL